MPKLPTLDELGVRDAEVFAFQGMLGPAGMPEPIVTRLNAELRKAMADQGVLKKFTDFGFEPLLLSPLEFKKLARAESERWGRVIRASHISLD
jgi:tripartite-type tricarboxylate transporter receptor subunit TctC